MVQVAPGHEEEQRKHGERLTHIKSTVLVGFTRGLHPAAARGHWVVYGTPKRIAALDTFCPFAPSLESAVLPSADDVTAALRDLLAY